MEKVERIEIPSTPESTPEKAPESTPIENAEPTEKIKRKIKAAGREVELEEEDLLKFATLGMGAHERFQESAKMRKEAEEMLKSIEEDPIKYLKSKKPEFRKMAEEYLWQEIQAEEEQANLSPDAIRAKELEKELERFKTKEKDEELSRKEKENKDLEAKYSKEYEAQLIEALEKTAIPRDPYIVRKIVSVMSDALESDIELSFEEAASMVKENSISEIRHFLSKVENIEDFLGEEITGKLRKSDLAKVKKGNISKPLEKNESIGTTKPKQYRGVEDMKADLYKEISKD